MIFLIDGNNFYASCERKRNQSLQNKPLIISSGQKGCVIARSDEVKKLGIKVGDPIFKIQDTISLNNIVNLPADISYYVEISRLMMQILNKYSLYVEIYSIDEAFIIFPEFEKDMEKYAHKIIQDIWQNVGVPVSIGVSETKVLCKIASKIAKKSSKYFVLNNHNIDYKDILTSTDISDIWGVGKALCLKLKTNDIWNAYQLSQLNPKIANSYGGINLENIVHELNGISAIKINSGIAKRKSILFSRSFEDKISNLEEIEVKLSKYVSRAAEKLRFQHSKTGNITVFLQTSRFEKNQESRYFGEKSKKIPYTNFTPDIIIAAKQLLKEIYKEGLDYKKVGIYFDHIIDVVDDQVVLFEDTYKKERSNRLMQTLDKINNKYHKNIIKLMAEYPNVETGDANWMETSDGHFEKAATIFDGKRFI